MVVVGVRSTAYAGIYSFGGGCVSQGSWTQKALEQTANLIQTIETLRQNPDCKGLETITTVLMKEKAALTPPPGTAFEAEQMEAMPGEVSSLLTSAKDPKLRQAVISVLGKKTLEGAFLSTMAGSLKGALTGLRFVTGASKETLAAGADALEKITNVLPNMDKCLIGHADQASAVLAMTVNLAAAFASSSEGLTGRLGNSISNILTMLKNRKFTSALRQLHSGEFWSSMSCLLETTTQAYCSTEDARRLVQSGVNEYHPLYSRDGKLDFENPMVGYYVLTRHLPNIANWLSQIQFGVSPKWSTDAAFKINALNAVTQAIQTIWRVEGQLNEDLNLLGGIAKDDLKGKQNTLMKLLTSVVGGISGSAVDNIVGAGALNFFTMSFADIQIPFFLLDIPTPKEVISSTVGGQGVDWQVWIKQGGNFDKVRDFNDPPLLAEKIKNRWKELAQIAYQRASVFYRQRIIVNQVALVTQSLEDQVYSVMESFSFVDQYLEQLESSLNGYLKAHSNATSPYDKMENKKIAAVLPGIADTRLRINKVISSYDDIIALKGLRPRNDEDSKKINDAYSRVIDMAFKQLDILLQRDSYLTNSVGSYINFDYAHRVRHRIDMSQYEQDLLMTAGHNLMDNLINTRSQPPSMIMQDINNAQRINTRNLSALEQVFRDSFVAMLQEAYYSDISKTPLKDSRLNMATLARLWDDTYGNGNAWQENKGRMFAWSLGGWFIPGALWERYSLRPDLYPLNSPPNPTIRRRESGIDQFRAKLCIQSIAFQKSDYFNKFCSGTVLTGNYLSHTGPEFFLNAAYDKENRKTTEVDRICAYRDFNRRNLVDFLARDVRYGEDARNQYDRNNQAGGNP